MWMMTKINIKADCGNAPKREFLKSFRIAMAEANEFFLLNRVTDDIVWSIVGDRVVTGKKSYAVALKKILKTNVEELTLFQILSHGKEGAVNGTIKTKNGDVLEFSDFYTFEGAKGDTIKSITTYLVKTK
jgi:hypothetical protein